RYALSHWDRLRRFLDNGRIELDSDSIKCAHASGLSIKKEYAVCG
ncbi:MAG: hypothetical protein QOF70_6861, partial [Acetobacteraceae bacterium]|nr:hypothetical protein [Acetobacteraceae bacterium]